MSGVAWLAFLTAAAVGAPARYLLDGLVQSRTGGAFPWGTLVVNLTGSFLLGVLTGLVIYHDVGSTVRTVIGTGGIGAYTTFSTFSFDTVRLAEAGAVNVALRNALGTLLCGLAAASCGLAIPALA